MSQRYHYLRDNGKIIFPLHLTGGGGDSMGAEGASAAISARLKQPCEELA